MRLIPSLSIKIIGLSMMRSATLEDSDKWRVVGNTYLTGLGKSSPSLGTNRRIEWSQLAHRYLLSFADQFNMTDMGAVSACLTWVRIKNRCPSRLTS
jgi:hypothetical protein